MVQLKYIETQEYLIFNKPIGLNSHSVDSGKDGLVEFLAEKTQQKLHTVSRLDQTTSGLILFAKDASVTRINQLWSEPSTIKTYLFLTDRKIDLAKISELENTHIFLSSDHNQKSPHFNLKTEIIKDGKNYHSHLNKNSNSETEFVFQKQIGSMYLWKAILHTGKTHQIRLHCANIKIPILGDSLYQGSAFYRTCLHSLSLSIDNKTHSSDYPLWANPDAEKFLLLNPDLQIIFEAIEKRKQIYDLSPNDCFRWLHQDLPGLKLDQFGQYLYLYDYSEDAKFSGKIAEAIAQKFKLPIFVRKMQNRGEDPNENDLTLYSFQEDIRKNVTEPITWTAQENEILFELRTHQGLSPGLFLDQRENRRWVLQNSKNKSVLNLFSYTSGFSLAAAKAEASVVDTVDVSKNFIEWSKQNFSINNLLPTENNPTPASKYNFWVQDCLFFLKMSIKKNKQWDLIICDPPTFGRSQNGVFQIEKNFEQLLKEIFASTSVGGKVLLSSNFEKWSSQDFKKRIQTVLKSSSIEVLPSPYQSLDFDYPHQTSLMKSYIIHKKN